MYHFYQKLLMAWSRLQMSVIIDGAYDSTEISVKAADKNIIYA
jgi:hypothetical protein